MNAVVSKDLYLKAHTKESANISQNQVQDIFARAAQYAADEKVNYAGGIPSTDAWILVQAGAAVLVDVRSNEERHFVGHVPAGEHVAWATGTSLNRNPRFVKELEIKLKGNKEQVIVLLCRSGKRSALAAEAAANAGFTRVYNILEGFEGELNEQQQRSAVGGWRFADLPWVQN